MRAYFRPWPIAFALAVVLAPTSAFAYPGARTDVPNGWAQGCITCHDNPLGGAGCANPTASPPRTATPWANMLAPDDTPLCPGCTDPSMPDPGPAPCLNPFGVEYQTVLHEGWPASVRWSRLYNLDADHDGWTNGEELGDPHGTWIAMPTFDSSTPPRINGVTNDPEFFTHPGDAGGTVDLCCIQQTADIDECAQDYDTCSELGTDTSTPTGGCDNVVARPGHSYTCTCLPGWGGPSCDTCATGWAGDACDTCAEGYADDGSGNCVDEDECALSPCDTNATCTNTDGSYTCVCNESYEGDGTTCTDIDECTDGSASCPAHTTCRNEIGAPYSCTCDPGFGGDPCGQTCGDGLVGPDEQCDDGNTDTGDGCDDACMVEGGYVCTRHLGDNSECTLTNPPPTDGGPTPDAGTQGDAGSTPPMDAGCSCRAVHTKSSTPIWLLLGALGAAVLWRRRSRR